MIKELTPAQIAAMPSYLDKWIRLSLNTPLDKEQARQSVEWMYDLSKLKKPEVIFVESPMGCQLAANLVKRASVGASVRASVWDSVEASVGASVRASVGASVRDSVGASVRDSVGASVWASVWASVRASVEASVRASVEASVRASVRASKLEFEPFASYGNISDASWVAYGDYFQNECAIKVTDEFDSFKQLLSCGIYDMIQLDGLAIVCGQPLFIHRGRNNSLHCDNGPAIGWPDGYELYFWHGAEVPKEWIMNPSGIDVDTIRKETNLERRRAIREIVGIDRYFEVQGGVVILDQDTDHQGNLMTLFESKEVDPGIDVKIQYLDVTCPSTGRKYMLYPPNQQSRNVWDAKASTFGQPITYRHGDVGLRLQGWNEKPLIET